MDHTTQTGGTCMDSSEMLKEWKELSQRSNDLEDDIRALEIRVAIIQKRLVEKKAEFHEVNARLTAFGKVMA